MAKKRAQSAEADQSDETRAEPSEAVSVDETAEEQADDSADAQPGPLSPHRLEAPYAYYTDDGVHKSWAQSHVVTDHEEILHLKERGARLIEIKS